MTDSTAKPRLLTFSSGGWVIVLSVLLSLFAAFLVIQPAFQTGFRQAIGDGRHVESYGFDLSNLTIPRAKLIASGVPKDGIRAIPESLAQTITPAEVDLIAKNEHIRFLVPSDRIIGVTIAGEARAYPLRVLALHEVANDTLGGVPLCISYSPLCDSIVVFDRRIDSPNDPPLEFGVSGLLVNSNQVLFDRRNDPARESLWSQLGLSAISGPKARDKMKLIPCVVTSWSQWRSRYPETRVLRGLRTLKAEYSSEPYNTYFADDQPRFPVDPLWSNPNVRKMTRIVATSPDGLHWTARPEPDPDVLTPDAIAPAPGSAWRIHSFLFAWYALHLSDTDYSALTPSNGR